MNRVPGFEKGLMLDVELKPDFKKHGQGLDGLIVCWGHHVLTEQGAESGMNKDCLCGGQRKVA